MLNRIVESTGTPPVKGNIRLGTRIDGKLQNTPHFILDEVPEVKEIYGESPDFLEVIFPSENIEAVAFAELQLWSGGAKDAKGERVGGDLMCSGPGPMSDGRPGLATWKNRRAMPRNPDEILSERDPKTGFVSRKCMAEGCCDWVDDKGNPRCKQTMQLRFIIPRVSFSNVYRITTHSWNSMYEFYRLLEWVRSTEGLATTPFRIYKDLKSIKRWDNKSQSEMKRAMPILKINKDDMFWPTYGEVLKEKMKVLKEKRVILLSPPEPEPYLLEEPGEYEVVEQQLQLESPAQRAAAILSDPEVTQLFDLLEEATGNKIDTHKRLRGIALRESEPDVKAAVIEGLKEAIQKSIAERKEVVIENVDPLPS